METQLGTVIMPQGKYEELVRENERLKYENDRLNGLLFQADNFISRIDNMYREVLDRIPQH